MLLLVEISVAARSGAEYLPQLIRGSSFRWGGGTSEPAVRVIGVRAIWWICRGRGIRVRVVVRRGGSGSGSADDGTRRDTGGDATPTWPVIAAPVATADVDIAVDVDVAAVDVGAVKVPAVDVGAVKVPAVDTASSGTGPGTSPGVAATIDAASGVSSAA